MRRAPVQSVGYLLDRAMMCSAGCRVYLLLLRDARISLDQYEFVNVIYLLGLKALLSVRTAMV